MQHCGAGRRAAGRQNAAGNCRDRLAKNTRSIYFEHTCLARMPRFKCEEIPYPLTEVQPVPMRECRWLRPA